MLAAGATIGLLAGLLGIGGGVIAVPVLLEVLEKHDDAAALSIGTAHAAVLLAAIPALAAHWRAGVVDMQLVRRWLPAILAGAAIGLGLGRVLAAPWLFGCFALLAAALAARLLARSGRALAPAPPAPPLGWLPPAA
ncbi:TSUP family transporter, partial [Falsiroseomonas oryziterrae]|uniref:TSUP family transporter n=1 Tax=Falsiroseomonas oryziterrae TaxID=2911368 RepID=UPI001F01BA71